MPLINWQLFDRVRAYVRKSNIFRQDNLYQDQTQIDRITQNGNFIEFSRNSGLLEQTNLQINRLERYKDYDMMDEVGEVQLALDIYADESSLVDPEKKHSVIVRSKSKKIKSVIEDFLYNTLMIDRDIRPLIRYLCKYGDFPAEIVPTKNRDGVASLRFINVYNFTRVQTKYGDLVGFYYQDPNTLQPIFLHPWQVMHLRLTSFESTYHPYGRSLLDGVRRDFKRLRMMEDAALIYRITRAPEKRIFSIPIGNIPANQIHHYITEIARQFKKHKFVDPATGQINERYSPLIQEDDFFLPKRPDGSGPEITTLPGAQNLDEIEDILYFKKKIIAGLKIPFSRVGIGEQADSDGKSLSSVSPEFAKATQWIQRETVLGLKKVVLVHLALSGYPIEELKDFDLAMTASSAIDELYRIETWNTRADIITTLLEAGGGKAFPKEWVLLNFTNLTEDEIEELEMKQKKKAELEAAEGNPDVAEAPGIGGGGMPGMSGMDMGGGAPPPAPGGPGTGLEGLAAPMEGVDKDEEKLLLEYAEFEKRIRGKRVIELDEPKVPKILHETSVAWYVNNNEFDNLPSGEPSADNNKVLCESQIPNEVVKKVREYHELMLRGDDDDQEIVEIANQMSEKQVINE